MTMSCSATVLIWVMAARLRLTRSHPVIQLIV